MDVKRYFKAIRQLEATIPDRSVVVVSEATVDGGRTGVLSEVPTYVGCQLVVEGRARLADPDEVNQYRRAQGAAADDKPRPEPSPNLKHNKV